MPAKPGESVAVGTPAWSSINPPAWNANSISQRSRAPARTPRVPPEDRTGRKRAEVVSGSQNKRLEVFERLSEQILETLKKLSADRQPLTTQSLQKALVERVELVDMIAPPTSAGPLSKPEGAQAEPADLRDIRARSKLLQKQRDQALQQVADLEQRLGRSADFTRRCATALIGLVRPGGNPLLNRTLDEFKNLLITEAHLDDLEKALGELKQVVIQESQSSEEARQGDGAGGLWGKWMTRRDTRAKSSEISREVYFKNMQTQFLNILSLLHEDLGDSYVRQRSEIQKKVNQAESFDHLVALHEDLIALIRTYTVLLREERKQAAAFIQEIGSSLLEMEGRFLCSYSHTSETHKANRSFDRVLETHMAEIQTSAQLSKSLSEFREVVINKLAGIRTAIDDKQRDDEIRMENAKREMDGLNQQLQAMKAEIEQIREKTRSLEHETLLDPLTGAHNHRAYKQRLRDELYRYHRYQQVFSLLLFDIDHFKRVNDEYGHRAGDRCLKEIIKRIRPTLRDTDFLARYGGEEFVILLPGIDRDGACAMAERLCRMVENTRFLYQGVEIRITISIGVTQAAPTDHTEEAIFNRADKAVYEAKGSGRNCVRAL